MAALHSQKGFTLIELIIVVFLAILLIVGGIYYTFLAGNFWFTRDGVLTTLQADHPEVSKIIKVNRGIWGKSKITVQENDQTKVYLLNTNILFNYSLEEK